jgi:hypothetical protein
MGPTAMWASSSHVAASRLSRSASMRRFADGAGNAAKEGETRLTLEVSKCAAQSLSKPSSAPEWWSGGGEGDRDPFRKSDGVRQRLFS